MGQAGWRQIERFNLAQQPLAFAENETVKGFLERSGQDALPLVLVDGEVIVDTTDFQVAAEALHRRALAENPEPVAAE